MKIKTGANFSVTQIFVLQKITNKYRPTLTHKKTLFSLSRQWTTLDDTPVRSQGDILVPLDVVTLHTRPHGAGTAATESEPSAIIVIIAIIAIIHTQFEGGAEIQRVDGIRPSASPPHKQSPVEALRPVIRTHRPDRHGTRRRTRTEELILISESADPQNRVTPRRSDEQSAERGRVEFARPIRPIIDGAIIDRPMQSDRVDPARIQGRSPRRQRRRRSIRKRKQNKKTKTWVKAKDFLYQSISIEIWIQWSRGDRVRSGTVQRFSVNMWGNPKSKVKIK